LPVSRCRWTATLPSPCHRLNRGGDRDANQALWRITLVRMAHDPRTRDYVARRTAEGKTKREIIRCLKRYIAREIYRAITNPPNDLPTGADLRRLRTHAGLTLTTVANTIDTTPTRLSTLERELAFDYPGPPWCDADGNKLSEDVIAIYHGPEHCQQHKADFLHLGWPLGTSAERLADSARQYVRDPDGELAHIAFCCDELPLEWRRLDELPPDAIETGVTTSENGRDVELWLSADRDPAVYITIDGVVEVWPLNEPPLGCD